MPKPIEIPEEVWEQMKYEYISTDISLRGIQKKYGAPYNQTRTRCVNEKWNELRESCREKSTQKSVDLIAEHRAEECTRAFRVASVILDKIEECVQNIDTQSPDALKDIKSATSSIKDLKEIGLFRAELDKAEQMARIKKLQKESEEEQKDTTITVVFEGDMEEYGD